MVYGIKSDVINLATNINIEDELLKKCPHGLLRWAIVDIKNNIQKIVYSFKIKK